MKPDKEWKYLEGLLFCLRFLGIPAVFIGLLPLEIF